MKKLLTTMITLALITACFAGCGKTESNTDSKTESANTSFAQEQIDDAPEETSAKIPNDYKLPASPEIIVYQSGNEIFHYNGETITEIREKLEIGEFDYYRPIDFDTFVISTQGGNLSIDVNSLAKDMSVVIDGMEVNAEIMNVIAPEGSVMTDTSTFKPDDWKTTQYANLTIIKNNDTGKVVGCHIQINNISEN